MSGFTAIPNDDFEGWLFSDPLKFRAWAFMLKSANYKDGLFDFKGRPIEVRRGELVLSIRNFADRVGMGHMAFRTFLKDLEKTGHIQHTTRAKSNTALSVNLTQNLTHITICNYGSYTETQHNSNTVATQQQHSSNTVATQSYIYISNNKDLINESTIVDSSAEISKTEISSPKKTRQKKSTENLPVGFWEYIESWCVENGIDYMRSAKEGAAVMGIFKKIKLQIQNSEKPYSDAIAIESLKLILKHLQTTNRWVYDNFDAATLNAQILKIMTNMRRSKAQGAITPTAPQNGLNSGNQTKRLTTEEKIAIERAKLFGVPEPETTTDLDEEFFQIMKQ